MVKKAYRDWEIRGQHTCGHDYVHRVANAAFIKGGYNSAQAREIDAQARNRECPRCELNRLLSE
jgi:hypothetical protein